MGLELKYEEGQTPLDEEEKEGLKIKSIKLKPEKILTEKFVKDLHKRMYGDVWKWAGEFRKSKKNIGISWIRIGIELKNLMDDTKYWIENNTYSPDEIAIRFKHRLVSIHCFPNGNGRHSRMMADIIMESIFDEDLFTWHQSKMVKANETRKEYINALRKADNGNVKPLIEFAKN